MARLATFSSIALLLSSVPTIAETSNLCTQPSAEDTFHLIDELPAPVVTAVKTQFPNLQPTMASCPQVGPVDREKPCFVKAGEYGSLWVVAVSTSGAQAVHGFAAISYNEGQTDARLFGPWESPPIPMCALNIFAGIPPMSRAP